MAMEIMGWLRQNAPAVFAGHDLQVDSRRLKPGDVFVALPGALPGKSGDGRDYIDAAIARGAVAVIVEAEGWLARDCPVPVLPVTNLRRVLGQFAARFYGQPSEALLAIGVTGTNGKTSCSQWIAQLLSREGMRCAVIGTIGSGFPDMPMAGADLTTPDAVALQRALRSLVGAGAQALAMEVSSIGLDQGRVYGVSYDIALFTNLTRDHLDYHGTMERYEAAKTTLFDWPTLTHAVINLDDPAGQRLVQRLANRAAASGVKIIGTTTMDTEPAAPVSALLTARSLQATAVGLAFELGFSGSEPIEVEVPLVGSFNVANLLGVAGVALAAGVPFARVCEQLPRLAPPPGRMERVGGAGEPLAVVDYAHTPDALDKALSALRPLAHARGGSLWVVFGAGGNRDPGKRAPMGEAAGRLADYVVITSDNPRNESPEAIVTAIASGIPEPARGYAARIVDRAEAIRLSLGMAHDRDVVLIAGKGHETYQEVEGVRRPFSDVAHAQQALAARRSGTRVDGPAPQPMPSNIVPLSRVAPRRDDSNSNATELAFLW
jgi:UDP-N-acetylmuramoyl-L-alanyl-D-glutamate--2,6-diaminopimelate ligase